MPIYGWKEGSRFAGSPQDAGEALEAIRVKFGSIKPAVVVEEARPKEHPLHSYFEWNDISAAQKWRQEQARLLIRCVTVKVDDTGDDPRAFVNVSVQTEDADPESAYQPLVEVRQNEELSTQVVLKMRNAISAPRRALERFSRLARVGRLQSALAEAEDAVVALSEPASAIAEAVAPTTVTSVPIRSASAQPNDGLKTCALCAERERQATAALAALARAEQVIEDNLGPKAVPKRPPTLPAAPRKPSPAVAAQQAS